MRANEELKYRCKLCTNPLFKRTGQCPFQWKHGKFVNRCRFYHNDDERCHPPSEYEIERRVSVLMGIKPRGC